MCRPPENPAVTQYENQRDDFQRSNCAGLKALRHRHGSRKSFIQFRLGMTNRKTTVTSTRHSRGLGCVESGHRHRLKRTAVIHQRHQRHQRHPLRNSLLVFALKHDASDDAAKLLHVTSVMSVIDNSGRVRLNQIAILRPVRCKHKLRRHRRPGFRRILKSCRHTSGAMEDRLENGSSPSIDRTICTVS